MSGQGIFMMAFTIITVFGGTALCLYLTMKKIA